MVRTRLVLSIYLVVVLTMLLPPTPVGASDDSPDLHAGAVALDDGTGFASDSPEVTTYSIAFGLDPAEAIRRLGLGSEAGRLDAAISDMNIAGYAGLWLQHEPSFRILVASTTEGRAQVELELTRLVSGTRLAEVVEIRSADFSLAELEADQITIAEVAQSLGMTTSIDVMRNRIIATPTETARPSGLDQDFPSTFLVETQAQIGRTTAFAYAGLPLSNGCTSGFTLVYTTPSPDTYFTSTAGHCSNTATLQGVSINYTSGTVGGNYDYQYGGVSSLTPINWMRVTPTTSRTVTSRVTRANQPINGWTCKYGNTTGETCGYLVSKTVQPSWIPNAAPVFMKVAPQGGPDMVNGGDSGGPVYNGHAAYGLVSGEMGLPWCICDLIFTAIPYAEGNSVDPMQPLHVYMGP